MIYLFLKGLVWLTLLLIISNKVMPTLYNISLIFPTFLFSFLEYFYF